MNIVVDACSIILLGKASVLRSLCNWHTIIVPTEVEKEVLAGLEKNETDALLFKQLQEEGAIKTRQINGKELENKFGLGKGEAEVIALKLKKEKTNFVLTDNRQGRKVAKILNLEVIGSPEILAAMYKKKIISKEKALNAVEMFQEFNWFRPEIIEKLKEEIKND